jgi:hypothetical protein
MAISFVGLTTTAAAGTAAISVAWPSGHATGDLGILVVENASGETSGTPAGWTSIFSGVNDTASNFSMSYRLATSSAEAAVTVADSGNHQVGRIFVFRGVDQTTPIGATTSSTKTTASTTITFPSLTTLNANSIVLFAASNGVDATSNTHTSLSGGTGLTSVSSTYASNSTAGTGGGFGVAYATKATAGATGTPTITLGTTSQNVNFVIEIKEAPAGLVNVKVRNTADNGWVTGVVKVRNAADNGWVTGILKPRNSGDTAWI